MNHFNIINPSWHSIPRDFLMAMTTDTLPHSAKCPMKRNSHSRMFYSTVHFVIPTTGHRCDVPGCGEVLVLDGNMKNSREVCLATHAGYAEFTGLPGRVQTGCPNTPGHKSRYCSLHAPCTALPQDIQFFEDGSPIPVGPTTSSEERHVAIILSKRVTRNSNFYQVTTMCIYTVLFRYIS